jgi:hypothetical protein
VAGQRLYSFLSVVFLVACGAESDKNNDRGGIASTPTDDTGSSDPSGDGGAGDSGGDSPGPVVLEPTWYGHIEPLLQTHCARCHSPDGVGPGDFTDRETVESLAEAMQVQIDEGEMPLPVSDPECRDYMGSDHLNMDEDERALFSLWLADDMPTGSPEDAPAPVFIQTSLDAPDLVVKPSTPYVPLYEDEANPGNEYRCFIIDPGREETFYITALAPLVEQPSIIHHIVLFSKPETEVEEWQDVPEGYDCIGSGMGDGVTGMLGGWAPGGLPIEYPDGYGMKIDPNDRLVLQIHYFQSGPETIGLEDNTGYAFRTADTVDTQVVMYPYGPTEFRIPAGDDSYTKAFSFPIPYSFSILGAFPHMHVLGSGYRMTLTHDGETQCLLESDKYDFANQQMFQFKEPVVLEAGDILSMECTWDNSETNMDRIHDPPIDVSYGERTDEEMCFAFMLAAY